MVKIFILRERHRSIVRKGLPIVAVIGAALLLTQQLFAADTPESVVAGFDASYSVKMDWLKGQLKITIVAPVDSSDRRNQAGIIGRKEYQIRSLFPSLFPIAIQNLRVNSTSYLSDILRNDQNVALDFQEQINRARLLRSQPSRDLKNLTLEYSFDIFPNVAQELLKFEHPLSVPALLDWKPSAAFTGLVIYAKDELPIYGSQERGRIVPSMFPRIYDQDTRLVLSADRAQNAVVTATGLVQFTTSITLDKAAQDRAGKNPMMIAARGLFGVTPTDLLVSREDADLILANPDTRKAISEGRVVIIIPDDRAQETLVE